MKKHEPRIHIPSTGSMNRRDFLKKNASIVAAGVAATSAFPMPAIAQGAKINIPLMSWMWNEPGRGAAWRKMLEEFHASQSDIAIKEAGAPFNEFTNQILIQSQSGAIDGAMFHTTPDLVVRLLRGGHLESLQDIVDNLGINDTLSASHDHLRVDGKVHGLDIVTVKFGLLYNSDMFSKAGVSVPTTPEEWVEVSTALTKAPDQFGIFSPHTLNERESFWFTLQQWAVMFDGLWANERTPLVNSEPVIQGLQLFKTMYDNAMPPGTDGATANQMYGNGRIAQQLIVSAAVNVWATTGPDIYQSLRSAVPPGPSGKVVTRIHPICVNAHAPDDEKAAAKAFIEWLYRPENYRNLMERSLDVVPPYPEAIRQEYLDDLFWAEGYLEGKAITPPEIMGDFIFFNQEFGNIVVDKFAEVLVADRPVAEAMQDAQEDLERASERLFEDFKL
jgi:ABC-type glycerol-3-phosphate transport system substrate-binding protein